MCLWSQEYYKKQLSNGEKQLYEEILKNIYKHNLDVYFKSKGLGSITRSIETVFNAIRRDHPEIFWINLLKMEVRTSLFSSIVRLESFQTLQERNVMITDCEKWRDWVINNIPRTFSEKDKVWLLFDYLARQMTYGIISTQHSQTILSGFSRGNHVSVCEGISKCFKYLCDSLGIPCIIVFGKTKEQSAEGHAWNIIECNNETWHIDVTREINIAHAFGKANKDKFLFKDFEMNDYVWDNREVPMCI